MWRGSDVSMQRLSKRAERSIFVFRCTFSQKLKGLDTSQNIWKLLFMLNVIMFTNKNALHYFEFRSI